MSTPITNNQPLPKLNIFSLKGVQMKTFHVTWLTFFFCFFALGSPKFQTTFQPPPQQTKQKHKTRERHNKNDKELVFAAGEKPRSRSYSKYTYTKCRASHASPPALLPTPFAFLVWIAFILWGPSFGGTIS